MNLRPNVGSRVDDYFFHVELSSCCRGAAVRDKILSRDSQSPCRKYNVWFVFVETATAIELKGLYRRRTFGSREYCHSRTVLYIDSTHPKLVSKASRNKRANHPTLSRLGSRMPPMEKQAFIGKLSICQQCA